MLKRQPSGESVPPTLQPQQAIAFLRRQLEQLEEIILLRHRDPRVIAWESTTLGILDGAFGRPNGVQDERALEFKRACGHVSYAGMPDSKHQANHVEGHQARKALLQAYIDQLEILAPPSAVNASNEYRFHPEIERVSGLLYSQGHYREASLNAYIRIIEEVKARSALANEDGDSLMNRAFGFQNQDPVIQFTSWVVK